MPSVPPNCFSSFELAPSLSLLKSYYGQTFPEFLGDERSDSKGVEPEGLTLGEVSNRKLAFIGMKRADAVSIYDVSNPVQPKFLQIIKSGDAPEGVLFISKKDSPIKRSLLIISSENDGVVSVYAPSEL